MRKVVVVTGGSRGIGAAIVDACVLAGYEVVYTYKNKQYMPAAREGVTAVCVDMADEHALGQFAADVRAQYGTIYGVILNAGIYAETPLGRGTLADFDLQMNVNLRGPWWLMQQLQGAIVDNGRVIAIGSISAECGNATDDVYGASKAGLALMCRSWARSLGPRGITVNCVQPGPIETDMNPVDAESAALTCLGRYGQTHEVASLVHYLLSDGGAFITGAQLNIDGGMLA